MRFVKMPLLILCFLLVFAAKANALSIDPTTTPQWTGISGPGVPMILADIYSTYGIDLISTELYKYEVDEGVPVEEGPLAGSYQTTFTPIGDSDPSGAIIEYTGGSYVYGDPAYLLVKDGNSDPVWYLFNLTPLGWDGMETLVLSNFWPGTGSISHVSLHGTSAPVPEPATMLLFGAGLCGLAFAGRKKLRLIGH